MKIIFYLYILFFSIGMLPANANIWNYMAGDGMSIDHLAINAHDPSVIYAASGENLFRSMDGGINWEVLGEKIEGIITSINIDPQNTNLVYVTTDNVHEGRIYKSTNSGVSWTRIPYSGGSIAALSINPHNTDVLFLVSGGTNDMFYKTSNAGATWDMTGSVSGPSTTAGAVSISVNPQNPDIIFIGAFQTPFDPTTDGIFKSIDQGMIWQNKKILNIGQPFSGEKMPMAINPHDPKIIYVGDPRNRAVQKSLDGGETWRNTTGDSVDALVEVIAIDNHNPEIVYLGTREGLFRSTNGGEKWHLFSIDQGEYEPFVRSIAIDPQKTEILYVGTSGIGLFKVITDSDCIARFDNLTQRVIIPCLEVDDSAVQYAIELEKRENELWFEVSDIKEK